MAGFWHWLGERDYRDLSIALLQITFGITWSSVLGIQVVPVIANGINILACAFLWYYLSTYGDNYGYR